MGLDKGEVGEAHGPVPYCGGPFTWVTHQTAGLPGERQQTGASQVPGFHGITGDGPCAYPPRNYGLVTAIYPGWRSHVTISVSFPSSCHRAFYVKLRHFLNKTLINCLFSYLTLQKF